jgi:Uma2 family endonuclease
MERQNSVKHEYHSGYVYAMSGDTLAHNLISGNVHRLLRIAGGGGPCQAFIADIKVRQSKDNYVYPDIVVTCEARDFALGRDWIDYPALVVEVLSRSIERHDRGDKFEGYKQIPTLREYVLISYKRREVEVRRRIDADDWTVLTYGPGSELTLESVGLTLSLDAIYEDSGL